MPRRIAEFGFLFFVTLSILSPAALFPQDEISASVDPGFPVAGGEFTLHLEIPGVDAASVVIPEPKIEDGLRFLGVDIRPTGTENSPGSSLVFRFLALKAGKREIANLEASIRGEKRVLGSWTVDVKDIPGRLESPRRASWAAPRTVWQFQQFTVQAAGDDGTILDLPGAPGIEGASAEMADDGRTVLLSARETCILPAADISSFTKTYNIEARKVSVRDLPESAGDVLGVGVFDGAIEAESLTAETGDYIPFSIRIHGRGIPVSARMPSVSLSRIGTAGTGSIAELEELTKPSVNMEVRGLDWFCTVTSRSGFYAAKEGTYRIRMESCRFFNPAGGIVETTVPKELIITVRPKAYSAPEINPKVLAALDASLASLAEGDSLWREALADFRGRNFGKALGIASAGVPRFGKASRREQEILASLLLVNGKIAEMNALLLPLERGFWPRRDVSRLLDAGTASSGFPVRPGHYLPAPAIFFLLAGTVSVLLATVSIVSALRKKAGTTLSGGGRKLVVILLPVLLLLCTICAFAAMAERSRPLFLTTGSIVRIVPSTSSTVSFAAPPGVTGRVLRAVSPWFFADFSDGRSGWLLERDVIFY